MTAESKTPPAKPTPDDWDLAMDLAAELAKAIDSAFPAPNSSTSICGVSPAHDFASAVETARDHIPIAKDVSADPGDFAIVDTGERFAVYSLRDFLRGGIAGRLVATVNLAGEVTPVPTMAIAETLEIVSNPAAMHEIASHKFDPTQLLHVLVNDLVERKALGAATRPVVHAVISGAQRRDELLRANGGVESSGATARRFGMTKQAVLTRAHHGTLLGLRTAKQNAVVFPLFQFGTDTGGLITGLDEVLRVLSEQPCLDGWAKCNFLLSPRDSLGGTTPLALLRDGHTRRVVNLARAYVQG